MGMNCGAMQRLAPLALAARQRLPDFPDLPTFAELGYPEFAAGVTNGERMPFVGWPAARPGIARVSKIADAPCPRACGAQAILPTLQAPIGVQAERDQP